MAGNRAVVDSNDQSYPIWVVGGRIEIVVLTAGRWTEFTPAAGVDAHLLEIDPVGRVRRTSTATFPDLVDGAAVTPAHLERSMSVYPGMQILGIDRDAPHRTFLTLAEVADGTTLAVRVEGSAA